MENKPFAYRGFMLDSARHYLPVSDILKIIEAASLCGMNRMHWHLTDDQGWRVEIKRYPLLTEKGSVRGRSYFGAENEEENNCGFYTQDDVRAVVAFAKSHDVEIVPEIEVPGHASAMLAAYPQFGCRRAVSTAEGEMIQDAPYDYQVVTIAGVFPNLICAGREDAVRFLEDILDEICELFPGPEIHIGGDEAIKLHWRRCPDCQRRMREEGLTDESQLQRSLVLQIGDYLAKKGKRVIVWNESLEGGLLPDHFIVQHWLGNDEETAAFMAAGGQVISSEAENYYISRPYSAIDVYRIFQADEVPAYAKAHPENLLGIECPLWGERVTNARRAAYQLFPRLAAVALKAQRNAPSSWEAFQDAVREANARVEALGLQGGPERSWRVSKEEVEADVAKMKALLENPDMRNTWRICDGLLRQEKLEKLLAAIDMPRPFSLRVMDCAWTEIPEYCGDASIDRGDGADEMAKQLITALDNREKGPWKDIPEDIWLATMRCFTRFVNEHFASTGKYAFDRGFWTTRQIAARIFRIGELEYELRETDDPTLPRVISLHIPSDAHMTADRLNESVAGARRFLKEHFPDWAGLPMRCGSWLLSPALRPLLDADSNILRFQRAFDIDTEERDSDGVLQWVFKLSGERQEGVDLSALPEDTTLQRRMKKSLLAGEKIGSAAGFLARDFE
ncbi:MAG: family 20 glycosylhydrolase [Clostridia bacterium]|nr:family 20 glycosylhydrolase [Clostridia bacterium]